MTHTKELKDIKKIPYKIANESEKLELIKSVLADDKSFDKWSEAMFIFSDSHLTKMVATELVRHQLSYSMNDASTTFGYKADMVVTIRFNYKDIIDVEKIVIDVFGDQYPSLLEQIAQHNTERNEFHDRLKTMNENSTMDDILAVFRKVKEDLKKN